MTIIAHWIWAMALGPISLVLAARWFQGPLIRQVPWVLLIVAALALLFLVQLREQWQLPPTVSLR